MKKKLLSLLLILITTLTATAQKENFSYKFYGFARGDFFVNSHQSHESFEGAFFLYPTKANLDNNGADVDDVWNSGFYMLSTRFGVDMKGPTVFNAKTSAKIEADFAGFSSSHTMLRLRHSYIKLDWEKGMSLLIGQAWHPLFGEVSPRVLNVATGAPFQPFSRTPQIFLSYKLNSFSIAGAAMYQYQGRSYGPAATNQANTSSITFFRNTVLPELYASITYQNKGLLLTGGVDYMTLRPRTESISGFKVDEKIATMSFLLAGKYTKNLFSVAAKSVLGQNLAHANTIGGYAVSYINPLTQAYTYTPYTHSTTWVNAVYGKTYQVGVYGGYIKNLGTADAIESENLSYGRGLDTDKVWAASAQFSYNLPHWSCGIEYSYTSAYYGDKDLETGRVVNTSLVDNHRIMALVSYIF